MGSSSNDPLMLGDLEPAVLAAKMHARDNKSKPANELEMQKEARLAEKEKRLAQKATQKMPLESPPLAPPPPKEDKSAMLDRIQAYRERFTHLRKRNNVSAKSTIDELEDELHYIEMQLGASTSSHNVGALMLVGSMHGIELITRDYFNPLGLNLNGLGTVAQQNMSEFQPIIDELMIKYGAGMYTSPEWRLALAMGAAIMTVHAANNNPEMAQALKKMNQAVSEPASAKGL